MKGEKKKIKKKQTTIKDLEDCIKKKEETIQNQDHRIRGLERIQIRRKKRIKKVLWYLWGFLCGAFTITYFGAWYYISLYVPMVWHYEGSSGGIPSLGFFIMGYFVVMASIFTYWILFKIFDGIEEML